MTSAAFTADGKTLATAALDKTVKLWDAASAKELATLSEATAGILTITFGPRGQLLAGSDNRVVYLWSLDQ